MNQFMPTMLRTSPEILLIPLGYQITTKSTGGNNSSGEALGKLGDGEGFLVVVAGQSVGVDSTALGFVSPNWSLVEHPKRSALGAAVNGSQFSSLTETVDKAGDHGFSQFAVILKEHVRPSFYHKAPSQDPNLALSK